ncbi:NAD-dependent epimerase/dehydratase family protein [Caldimonas caldifontis]|uniref:GDP-mannose 4,6 dehydratase n=1 Tax=Caldimonas caldifontis TaxID=1452508 RepID=A0A2S5SX47_9BURK|nr:GDP-mannose 4,6-dehydratase [Caldimonas caldifontis]PPE67335.1 GDP-mannose 4,6 dehydratase [Caldimonas caldifontis]
MTRALITGIEGFTGHHLAQTLREAGYEVFGTCHGAAPANAHVHACDLRDAAQVGAVVKAVRPEVVVHLAAISFVAHGQVDDIYMANVVGTRHLLDALAQQGNGVRKVILASSANIYGNSDATVLDESVPPAPANDYAVSKLAMEHMARLWADRLPLTIVRPFNYTGVGQSDRFLLPKIVSHFRRHEAVIELGNLDVVRDFSDVRMVVECYRRLIEPDALNGTFNVCSGVGHSLQDVLALMRQLTGHEIEVRVNPAFVRANEVHTLIGSRARLDAAIGAVPAIALADTLRWMLEA